MPIEIEFDAKDRQDLYNLSWCDEIFLKSRHQKLALKAYNAVLNLEANWNEELISSGRKNKQIEDQKEQIKVLQHKVYQQGQTFLKKNDELVEAEEVNHQLNIAIENFDKTVAKLEKEIEDLTELKYKYESILSDVKELLKGD